MKNSPYLPQYDELRQWLREKREAAGLTVREVAEEMDRHHSVIGKMETMGRNIEIMEFIWFCDVVSADPLEGIELIIKAGKPRTKRV